MTHQIFHKVSEIPQEDWNQVLQDRNIYLSSSYLKVIEDTLQDEVTLFFSISYQDKVPVLITVFQLVTFIDKREQWHKPILKILADSESKKQPFKMNMLVCGNVFADGEHGFVASHLISNEALFKELVAISAIIKRKSHAHKKVSVRLFKEFWPASVRKMDALLDYGFKDFHIDVNMVLDIHPSWNTFDDYLRSMKAKFRTKANSAYKRSSALAIRSLSETEIAANKQRIDLLFTNVLNKSNYRFGSMNARVFAALKKNLGADFSFSGVYLDTELVGFSIAYFHNNIMEAGYVGLDYSYNKDYAIYQRILYHYVEQAINKKVKQLQLGRTSELIKSALGARPVDMKLYAKHKRPLTNMLMRAILHKVTPSEYELRRPFKSGFEI